MIGKTVGLAVCGLLLACGGSGAVDLPDAGPSLDDGSVGGVEGGAAPPEAGTGPTCGFCYGENCCCSGLDSECDPGYACYLDGLCDPMATLSASLHLSKGAVTDKDPSGQPWDPDGGPDLVLVVSVNGAEVYRSSPLTDTISWNQGSFGPVELDHIDDSTPLVIQIFDQDDGQETLIGEARWDQGVPSWILQGDAIDVVPLLTPPPTGLVRLELDVVFVPAY